MCFECKCTQCPSYLSDLSRCIISLQKQERWEKVLVEIDGWLKETEKAYLVVVDGDEVWLPKSLTELHISAKRSEVELPRWLAIEKGVWEEEYG